MSILIRPYEDRDRDALLALWDTALPLDGVSLPDFERRVLLDWNREPDSLMLAFESAGSPPIGFILCLILRYPIENTGTMDHRGFITVFGVHPDHRKQGVGTALLAKAEEFFRARNRKEIVLAPYTPNYFVPGVDKERYAEGLAFLQRHGYQETSEGIGADAMIGRFELSEEVRAKEKQLRDEGITVETFKRAQMVEFMDFMAKHMPGPWLEDARRNLRDMTHGRFPEEAIFVALDKGKIIGYCQFEGQHFGPFGVIEGYQGRGVGSVLLAKTLYQMRLYGNHVAFVLWTGERALKGVYGRLGFTLSRRFAVLRKKLEG